MGHTFCLDIGCLKGNVVKIAQWRFKLCWNPLQIDRSGFTISPINPANLLDLLTLMVFGLCSLFSNNGFPHVSWNVGSTYCLSHLLSLASHVLRVSRATLQVTDPGFLSSSRWATRSEALDPDAECHSLWS